MAVFKIEKNKNYTVMSNYHLRDKNLSYKAKGLLSFMLSLPDDWDYSINGLTAISKEGVKSIQSILKELEENGYLIRNRINKSNGQFDYEYLIYEEPYTHNRCTVKGQTVKGCTVNGIQINTNKQNTKKQIDKDDKQTSSFFDADNHNRLTTELVNKKYIDDNDIQIPYYDNLFNKLLIDNSYKEIITIINYIVPRVLSRDFKDENGKYITNKFGYLKNSIYSNIEKLNNYNSNELWDYNDYIDDSDNLYDLKDYDEFER